MTAQPALFADLPGGPFDVVLADPPWRYSNMGSGLQGLAGSHYQTLTIDQLEELPVVEVCAPRCVLVMWATWPKLPDAMRLIDAWGFEFKTGLPWVKVTKALDKVRSSVGFWMRATSEPVLIAVRGKASPPPPASRRAGILGNLGEVLLAPRQEHSAKPDAIYEFAESLTAHLGDERLELFARGLRDGWTCWGQEALDDEALEILG